MEGGKLAGHRVREPPMLEGLEGPVAPQAEARDGASPGRKGFGRSASGEFRAPAV